MKVAGLAALVVIVAACTISQSQSTQTPGTPSAATFHTLAGGCAGTVLTDAEPPAWAQGGWNHQKGTPWPVPWAWGTDRDAVGFVFATQLVAGPSPRVDGSNNKVLWETKDFPSGSHVTVDGHPAGVPQPVVTVAGGPSIVDVPTAGCWIFRLSWTANNGSHSSTISLQVLPHGTLPA
jgi:hypothetical protein